MTIRVFWAKKKGICLNAEKDDEFPEEIKGDPTRIRQIIVNLVGNAIKTERKD